MANYFVTNAATNGYSAGSDSNAGTSRGSPFLTWNHATSVAGDADTINGNPTGTPYREDLGTNGLVTTQNNLTLQTDQTLVGAHGNCTIQGNGTTSTRVVNMGGSSGSSTGLIWNDLTFDAENLGINIFVCHNHVGAGATWNRCVFKNQNSASRCCIGGATGTGSIYLINACSADSTVNTFMTSGDWASLVFAGGTYTCSQSIFPGTFPGSNSLTLHVTKDANNVRGSYSGMASGVFPIRGAGTIAIEIDHCDFSGNWSVLPFSPATPCTGLTSVLYHDNTSAGTTTNPDIYCQNATCASGLVYNNVNTNTTGLIDVTAENVSGFLVYDNDIACSGTGQSTPIALGPIGTGCKVYDNDIAFSNGTMQGCHGILIGMDGQSTDASNTTATGTQKLFDVSGNTFVEQKFTTSALTVGGRASYIAGVTLTLTKTGSPTGSVTCKLYDDSGGNPNNLLETSTTTVACSTITGSNQVFFFEFASHYKMTAATPYHIVLTITGGSVNASNYVTIANNSTTTGGVCQTSTTGPGGSWTSTSKALIYAILTGSFGCTDVLVYGNHISSTTAGSQNVHGIEIGCTAGGSVFGNEIYGTSIGYIPKDGYNVFIFANVFYSTTSSQAAIYNKGSHNSTIVGNACVMDVLSSSVYCYQENQDNQNGVNSNTSGAVVEGNVFVVGAQGSGTQFIYDLAANPLGVYPTPTIDYNTVYGADSFVSIEKNRYSTFAAWQGAGFDTHGQNTNPGLVNIVNPSTAIEFKPLAVTSAVVRAGTHVSGVANDYAGNLYLTPPSAGAYEWGTYELTTRATSGSTVYGIVRNALGLPFNATTGDFEGYTADDLDDYALVLTEMGASGVFVTNFPYQATAGLYSVDYRIQVGGSPAQSDTQITDPFSRTIIWWDGFRLILPVGIPQVIAVTS